MPVEVLKIITCVEWHKTSDCLPPMGRVVLGFWSPTCIQTVVCHDNDRWNAPGYFYSEYRVAPDYWAEINNLPVSGGIE